MLRYFRIILLASIPLVAVAASAQEMKPIPPVKPIPRMKPIPQMQPIPAMKDPMGRRDGAAPPSEASSPPRKSNPVKQPNSCGSTDRCVAPAGGSCECHCEGTRSVCTFDYGPNGPPKD